MCSNERRRVNRLHFGTERIFAGGRTAARKREKKNKRDGRRERGLNLDRAIVVGQQADTSVDTPVPTSEQDREGG